MTKANVTTRIRGNFFVCVSYRTPVAAVGVDQNGAITKVVRTSEYYSVTTSKHINQFFKRLGVSPKQAEIVPQDWFQFASYPY